ncbi:MAG: calcium-binding protein [Pseudomonadota bacterium]
MASHENPTIIPDGDDQTRTSAVDGETFVLGIGDATEVDGAPVVIFEDDDVTFKNLGTALTTGDTATVEIEGDGGTVLNGSPGRIDGMQDGIAVFGDDAVIDNEGNIFGGFNGVRLVGDHNTLFNSGEIQSDSRAVDILGEKNTVINVGDIVGTGDQRNGTVYANSTAEDILLVNRASGAIDAGFGNDGAGVSFEIGDVVGDRVEADIVNFGRISGRGDAPLGENTRGDGVRLFSSPTFDGPSTYDGKIVNHGFITSDEARGIEIQDGLAFDGTILNTGTIFGATDGVYFGDGAHEALLRNFGEILSQSRAVNIDGSDVTLVNHGDIVGTADQRNGTVYTDATADDFTIFNAESGLIDAGVGNSGSGISLQVGDSDGDVVSGRVVNHGSVIARGDGENDDGITFTVGTSGDVTFRGDVINHGLIESEQDGIVVDDPLTFIGDIVNRGTIDVGGEGIEVVSDSRFIGDIVNHGSILAEEDGIDIESGVAFVGDVVNRGEIVVGSDGFDIDAAEVTGDVVNYGTVRADSDGIDVDVEALGGKVINYGVVVGDQDGDGNGRSIDSEDALGPINVLNFGRLVGEVLASGGAGSSVENHGRITGPNGVLAPGDDFDLLNHGLIRGIVDGVQLSGADADAENHGRIVGDLNGVNFVNGGTSSGDLTNFGRIASDSRAVNIGGDGVELENHGLIVGTGDQRNGTVYSDGTSDNVFVENSVTGRIDAGLGNDGSGAAFQIGDVHGDTVFAELANDGVIRGRGDATDGNTVGDGVRVFSSVEDTTVVGDLANHGVIYGSDESDVAVGISIEDGVTLDGEIFNTGVIRGSVVAVDASEAGGDVTVVNKGVIHGDVLLSHGNDTYDGDGGVTFGVVHGLGGDDLLIGGAESDTLSGGAGDDTLEGGGGDDVLSGGLGNDIFVFSPTDAPSLDTVTDFEDGVDLLDLTGFGFQDIADLVLTTVGADVVLEFATDNSAVLENTILAALSDADFIF